MPNIFSWINLIRVNGDTLGLYEFSFTKHMKSFSHYEKNYLANGTGIQIGISRGICIFS
jgi:hypothetical protein